MITETKSEGCSCPVAFLFLVFHIMNLFVFFCAKCRQHEERAQVCGEKSMYPNKNVKLIFKRDFTLSNTAEYLVNALLRQESFLFFS